MGEDGNAPRSRGPAWLSEGSEPDPRFTLANERTFLAWIRTALALLAAGVAVSAILPPFGSAGLRTALGALLAALGLLLAGTSYSRWARAERALRRGGPLPHSPILRVVAAGVGAVCALVLILLISGRLAQ
jgi:putative membrane protein